MIISIILDLYLIFLFNACGNSFLKNVLTFISALKTSAVNITIFLRIRVVYHCIWNIFLLTSESALSRGLGSWLFVLNGIGLTIFAFKVQVPCKPLTHNTCLCYASVITYWHQAIDRLATDSFNRSPFFAPATSDRTQWWYN